MSKFMFLLMLITPLFSYADEPAPISFRSAKKKIYTQLNDNHGQTYYCGCSWNNKKVNLASCGLQNYFPKKHKKRSERTEVEHVIPASWLLKVNNRYRQCAIDAKAIKQSPRQYCQKHDANYKRAHNDLVNLFPVVGQVNAERSNKPFLNVIKGDRKIYGKCGIAVSSRGFIPPDDIKGDIARIAFYMSDSYGVTYSKRQVEIFYLWKKIDPVSEKEVTRNNHVIMLQGIGLQL